MTDKAELHADPDRLDRSEARRLSLLIMAWPLLVAAWGVATQLLTPATLSLGGAGLHLASFVPLFVVLIGISKGIADLYGIPFSWSGGSTRQSLPSLRSLSAVAFGSVGGAVDRRAGLPSGFRWVRAGSWVTGGLVVVGVVLAIYN